MSSSLGAIRVSRMILTSTFLSLGSLAYCVRMFIIEWYKCDRDDPSILETALQYPYTIIIRVGLMYSLFIIFLQLMFIKWWLETPKKIKAKGGLIFGIISLVSYGFFVCCIDRRQINYVWMEWAVFIAAISNFMGIFYMFKDIYKMILIAPSFVSRMSWRTKQLTFTMLNGWMWLGILVYIGYLDISWKNQIEYGIVVSTYLFYLTFMLDLGHKKMDIGQI